MINGTLINKNGISIQFDSDPAGVTLGAAGTNAATANFGTVSAFGPLSGGCDAAQCYRSQLYRTDNF